MSRISFTLESADVFQLLDALSSRAESWEKTAAILKGENTEDDDELFVPEECSYAEEAEAVATHFRDLISKIETQFDSQV